MSAPVATQSREQLIARKEDVYAALRTLERDRAEGTIDERAYDSARRRYELEAAALLEHLDSLEHRSENGDSGEPRGWRTRTEALSLRLHRFPVWLGALTLVTVAAAIFLIGALHDRGNGPITGSARTVVSTPTSSTLADLATAETRVKKQPTSINAYLDLGNAFLNANQPAAADRAFVRAMTLAPSRPEARTMHALILAGSSARPVGALALLGQVEVAHPSYSHAWLVDGLLSARSRSTVPRAIAAFQRFLVLAPHAPVSPQVRILLAGLERIERQARSRSRP